MPWAAVGGMGRNQPVTQLKVQKQSHGPLDVKGWSGMQVLSEPREVIQVKRKVYLILKRAIHVGVALKK